MTDNVGLQKCDKPKTDHCNFFHQVDNLCVANGKYLRMQNQHQVFHGLITRHLLLLHNNFYNSLYRKSYSELF